MAGKSSVTKTIQKHGLHNKTQKKIKKLINNLRKSQSESNLNNSVIIQEDILSPQRISGINNLSNCSYNPDNVITIDDDELTNNNRTPSKCSQITCSTPIAGHDKLSELIFKNNIDEIQKTHKILNLSDQNNTNSYLTIDLTGESENNTVINLDNIPDTPECTLVSISSSSLMSNCDSDITVISSPSKNKVGRHMNQFNKGIARMSESAKGRLLQIMAEKIFNGCGVPKKIKQCISNVTQSITRSTETAEDKYIKEVILGESPSSSSVGSNIYHPSKEKKVHTGLRLIVIDGSNVAMEHTRGREFSVKGLNICIDYFLRRGHTVKAFVPRFRAKFGKSSNPRLLDDLERRGLVIYTPSREIQGRTITSYDDRYIIQCAAEFDGVIVSGDQYRDLANENPKWKFVINNRLLPFTWVDDMIMFPKDPLGRNGPTLEQFLKHPNPTPTLFSL